METNNHPPFLDLEIASCSLEDFMAILHMHQISSSSPTAEVAAGNPSVISTPLNCGNPQMFLPPC